MTESPSDETFFGPLPIADTVPEVAVDKSKAKAARPALRIFRDLRKRVSGAPVSNQKMYVAGSNTDALKSHAATSVE